MSTEDDNNDALSNEHLQRLNDMLFSQRRFVMLTMNYRKTGCFDCTEAKRSILELLKNCGGIGDIVSCCKIFAEAMDDFVQLADKVTPMFKDLMKRYESY
jgi:hypothetical protein